MALWQWSHTATSNATSDPTMNWSEGIPPSIVNDNVRAMMARVAEYRDDVSGILATTGTPPNYSLVTFEVMQTPTPFSGQLLSFFVNATNVGSDTLACDGGTAFPIQSPAGTAIGAGVLVAGTPYTLLFTGTAWVLRDFYGSPFVVPVGAMIDWTGGPAPNSNFVLPFGQAISRTTYSVYNAILSALGYPYGSGDGSTTFNVIDMRGRSSAGLDNMGGSAAGRIGSVVTDSGTIVGTTLGSAGGSSTHVQAAGEVGNHNHTASSSDGAGHSHSMSGYADYFGGSTGFVSGGPGLAYGTGGGPGTDVSHVSISTTVNNNSGGAAMALLQPTIMCNKLLRIL